MGRPPSLLDLCVQSAIDNVRYLADVGETDSNLLKVILPHCTPEQLLFIEDQTEGRDLSPITDYLWLKFYERKFGEESANLVKKRMKQKRVCFKWKLLYQAKAVEYEKEQQKSLEKSLNRLRQLYAKADQEKQSKQIQICTKAPPAKRKRNYGGSSNIDLSNVRGRLMKKAKMEFVASREARANASTTNRNSAQSMVPLGRVSNVSTSSAKSSSAMTSRHMVGSNMATASAKCPSSMTSRHVLNSNIFTASAKSSSSLTSTHGINSSVSKPSRHVMNLKVSESLTKSSSTMVSSSVAKLNITARGSSITAKDSMPRVKSKTSIATQDSMLQSKRRKMELDLENVSWDLLT